MTMSASQMTMSHSYWPPNRLSRHFCWLTVCLCKQSASNAYLHQDWLFALLIFPWVALFYLLSHLVLHLLGATLHCGHLVTKTALLQWRLAKVTEVALGLGTKVCPRVQRLRSCCKMCRKASHLDVPLLYPNSHAFFLCPFFLLHALFILVPLSFPMPFLYFPLCCIRF